jgi:uncharacterized protein YqfA (UPF0365 family)
MLRGVECIILATFFGFVPVFVTIVLTGGAAAVTLRYLVTLVAFEVRDGIVQRYWKEG